MNIPSRVIPRKLTSLTSKFVIFTQPYYNKQRRIQGLKAHLSASAAPKMSFQYLPDTPEEAKNGKDIHLITQSTPNGAKVQIFLEELAEKYGTTWSTSVINIGTNIQKEDWFLNINPNGRVSLILVEYAFRNDPG